MQTAHKKLRYCRNGDIVYHEPYPRSLAETPSTSVASASVNARRVVSASRPSTTPQIAGGATGDCGQSSGVAALRFSKPQESRKEVLG